MNKLGVKNKDGAASGLIRKTVEWNDNGTRFKLTKIKVTSWIPQNTS